MFVADASCENPMARVATDPPRPVADAVDLDFDATPCAPSPTPVAFQQGRAHGAGHVNPVESTLARHPLEFHGILLHPMTPSPVTRHPMTR